VAVTGGAVVTVAVADGCKAGEGVLVAGMVALAWTVGSTWDKEGKVASRVGSSGAVTVQPTKSRDNRVRMKTRCIFMSIV
jgi:hypothetical protein